MSTSFRDYRVLRTSTVVTDDADWAGGDPQTLPADSILVQIKEPSGAPRGSRVPLKVEVILEWLNTDGTVDTTTRGTFSIQGIRVMDRSKEGPRVAGDSSVVADRTKCVVDTAALTLQVAYRPIVIDEVLPGDAFTVRLSSMVPSTGATGYRVLMRELY